MANVGLLILVTVIHVWITVTSILSEPTHSVTGDGKIGM